MQVTFLFFLQAITSEIFLVSFLIHCSRNKSDSAERHRSEKLFAETEMLPVCNDRSSIVMTYSSPKKTMDVLVLCNQFELLLYYLAHTKRRSINLFGLVLATLDCN